MIQFLSNIPIFRRLFLLFALATIIPGIVIVLLGNFYITSLDAKSSAVKTSFAAQSLAAQEETNLQRMNAQLQAKFYQVFASDGTVITDPSLSASGELVDGEIKALEADFDRNLKVYQSNYALSSSNMNNVRDILLNDSQTNGQQTIDSQAQALNLVAGQDQAWSQYQHYQDQELKQLENLQSALQNGKTLSTETIKDDYNQAYDTLHSAILAFTNLKNDWQQVVDDAVSMGVAVTAVGPAETQAIFIATAAAFLLTVLVIVVTASMVNRTITNPLGQLSTMAERIAEGNTSARATVRGRDEIGKVADAMNNMLNHIVRLIQDAQHQHEHLQSRVEKLVSEVSGVGEGDLRIQAEVTTDALGVLADSFNYMIEELSSLVVRVKMMASDVENSTALTFESMTMLVANADAQIQQIGRAAREVERMAESSRQVAERSQSLYSIANEARHTAQTGRQTIIQTIEGINRIQSYVEDTSAKVQALGDSSREIDNIVGVISTIAHQTNRLALDAAVQAATAGENGKGFAAVAADIRRLAERAKDQANTIARIVRTVGEDIEAAAVSMKDTERETFAGAKMAEDTGITLESIFNVVERQGREIELINQVSTQQLQSSNAVVHIMQGVSQATQRSSAGTREAARNMERLAHLAEQLLASVEAFKLREAEVKPYNGQQTLPYNGQQGLPYNGQPVLSMPALTPSYAPGQLVRPYLQREGNTSGPLGPQSPGNSRNTSGLINPQQNPNINQLSPNQSRQSKLKQNRLLPPAPPERR
jgi:methyl-accepting chemotaxis protein